MTNHETIQFLDNMKHEEAGRAIGKDGIYAELMGCHVQALNVAIKSLGAWGNMRNEIDSLVGTFPKETYLKIIDKYMQEVDE